MGKEYQRNERRTTDQEVKLMYSVRELWLVCTYTKTTHGQCIIHTNTYKYSEFLTAMINVGLTPITVVSNLTFTVASSSLIPFSVVVSRFMRQFLDTSACTKSQETKCNARENWTITQTTHNSHHYICYSIFISLSFEPVLVQTTPWNGFT